MTPAEELHAAATKLRETAAKVDCGPPWAVAEDCPDIVCSADIRPYGAPWVASEIGTGDAAWIALVHPGLAGHWADLLDLYAEIYAAGQINMPGCAHALAIARAINRRDEVTRA